MENSKYYTFSVIIPCFNEQDYIESCIQSIVNQDYDKSKIEIVIVDGGSTDNTVSIIDRYQALYSFIKLFHNPLKNTAASLNIGIKSSKNQIVVILGAHAKIDAEFLKFNNKFLLEKNVTATGGTQLNVGKTFIQKLIGIVMEIPFAMASASYRWSKKEHYVDTVVYAAYKREIFNEIGYFEENFPIAEDAEINWRIKQAGHKIFYSPKIKSYYYPRDSITKFIKQMFRYGILRVNMLKKHFDSLKFTHLIPPLFVVTFCILFMMSFFSSTLLNLFIILLIVYFTTGLIASVIKLFPQNIIFLPFVSFLIFLQHFSWGLGFIFGLLTPRSKN